MGLHLKHRVSEGARATGDVVKARTVVARSLVEAMRSDEAKAAAIAREFSIREAYEALCLDPNNGFVESPRDEFQESGGGGQVSSAFHVLTSNVIQKAIIESYDIESALVGDKLVTPDNSNLREETYSGTQAIELSKNVGEAEEFPIINIKGEKSFRAPEPKKMGARIALTKETIKFDNTGKLMRDAAGAGRTLAYERDVQILSTISDVEGYKRYYPRQDDGTYTNTALWRTAAGASWFNQNITQITNAMSPTNDDVFKNIMDNFASRTDEAGRVISVMPKAILVPSTLWQAAMKWWNGMVSVNSLNASAGTPSNELRSNVSAVIKAMFGGTLPELVPSPILSKISSSNWFVGDFKRSLFEQIIFPITVERATPTHTDSFNSDIVTQWKISRKADITVAGDTHLLKCV